jgi:hypothetical protein
MLVDWIVTTNQPFTVVEDSGFDDLLQYAHHGQDPLRIPSATTIKRRVINRTDDAIDAQRQVFEVNTNILTHYAPCQAHKS